MCSRRARKPKTDLELAPDLHPAAVGGVDCFKCSSRNGSNPACEDPFHNLNTTRVTTPFSPEPPPNVIYHTPCYAGKKGREGLFLASACIKLTGTFGKSEPSFSQLAKQLDLTRDLLA